MSFVDKTAGVDRLLISHRYRFIFLKTEKTASTSLFEALAAVAAERDPLHRADVKVKRSLLREHGTLQNTSFVGGCGAIRRWFPRASGLHVHALAPDVRDFIGSELFAQYTVITSERNPFDRQVSLFNHRRQRKGADALGEFSNCMVSPAYNSLHYNRLRNWEIYAIRDQVCADVIIRFEHLQDDFRELLAKLGIDAEKSRLPHLRHGQRPKADYRRHYTDAARRAVASWYRREIAHFGYKF